MGNGSGRTNYYDQAARFAIKLDPPAFLRWLLPEMAPNLVFTRWLDTQRIAFPGEGDLRCDTVAELAADDGSAPPWALVIEVQTYPDANIRARLLEYLGRLLGELRQGPHGQDRYEVGAALVYLTGTAPAARFSMVLPGQAGVEMHWSIGRQALTEHDAASTLAAINEGRLAHSLLPWIPLMCGGDQPATLAEWKQVGEKEPDPRRKTIYRGLALVFAGLTDCEPLWLQTLEGWNVKEPQIVKQWQAEALEKGVAISRVALRDAVLLVLRCRFSESLPAELIDAIQTQKDLDSLSRWLERALTAKSLDEFRTVSLI